MQQPIIKFILSVEIPNLYTLNLSTVDVTADLMACADSLNKLRYKPNAAAVYTILPVLHDIGKTQGFEFSVKLPYKKWQPKYWIVKAWINYLFRSFNANKKQYLKTHQIEEY